MYIWYPAYIKNTKTEKKKKLFLFYSFQISVFYGHPKRIYMNSHSKESFEKILLLFYSQVYLLHVTLMFLLLICVNSDELTASHLYTEVFTYQSEQRGGKVNLAVTVHGHIHPDELLVRQAVRALVAKPQRRIHIFQHVIHLRVMDLASGVRIVLGPDPDKLVKMMRTQDWRVAGEVIEVVHDDGDEEI